MPRSPNIKCNMLLGGKRKNPIPKKNNFIKYWTQYDNTIRSNSRDNEQQQLSRFLNEQRIQLHQEYEQNLRRLQQTFRQRLQMLQQAQHQLEQNSNY